MPDFEGDLEKRREMITHAAKRWLEHVRHVERAKAKLGSRLLQIRYRDLVEAPETHLPGLFRHLDGVKVTDEIIADVLQRCSFATMSGGRQPGETDDDSFFRSGTVGQYVSDLRPEELALVESMVKPALTG